MQEINDSLLKEKGLRLLIKREDLIHPIVSGNKWRKLKYNLSQAKTEGYTTLLSFGGAYSNHLHALAAAAQDMSFRSIGVIRGEEMLPLNATLAYAQSCGMKLHFVTREIYKTKTTPSLIETLTAEFGDFFLIPEGGSNPLGVRGCAEILGELEQPWDIVCTACGTGTTMAGLVTSLPIGKKAIGFPVLKGGSFLYDEINGLLSTSEGGAEKSWHLEEAYHFGGYAKWNTTLLDFIADFKNKHNIQLDQVYTGKMMYGLMDLIRNDFFERGTIVVALHTGGLQGLSGIE